MEDLANDEEYVRIIEAEDAQPEDAKNTAAVELDRPTAPEGATVVEKADDPADETTPSVLTNKSVIEDRPIAPEGAKPTRKSRKKVTATKAAAKVAPDAPEDRPTAVKAACQLCGREEVLAPMEIVPELPINLCLPCKTDIENKVEVLLAAKATEECM